MKSIPFNRRLLPLSLACSLALTGCGAGDIELALTDDKAYEKENDVATFTFARSDSSIAIPLGYEVIDTLEPGKTPVSANDYRLEYSSGEPVGDTIVLPEGEGITQVNIVPVGDNDVEVIETLRLRIMADENIKLIPTDTLDITISDAKNTDANKTIFTGIFQPQDNAQTNGSGSLSFVLEGDRSKGYLSYNFSGLTSEQTDQHIHLAPAGNMIKDIDLTGNISNWEWDLQPGGFFTTRQQMLDALFSGELFVNIHSSNYPTGEIAAFLKQNDNPEGPDDEPLTEAQVNQDILRFLTQTTFGPTPQDYQALRDQIAPDGANRFEVYENWLEQQFNVPQTSLYDLTLQLLQAKGADLNDRRATRGWHERSNAFWPIALHGKDQLRQRIAFALSEILVIGDTGRKTRDAYLGLADYWDSLAENAFNTYRSALGDATRHPLMGTWLSHLQNQKANPEEGFSPDENYAREVMQLFGFGLVQRNMDGSLVLGDNFLPVATYDNRVIQEMARVFTGLSFSSKSNGKGELVNNNRFDLPEVANAYQYRWTEPMKMFPEHHDFGEKVLFTDNGVTITSAPGEASAAAAEDELDYVLDQIVAHSTAAPFISRLLIQRLVTSNPSREYIERVATVFGQTGDMKAVVKAILLDQEARTPTVVESDTFGKVKEPVLRFTSLMRLLDARSKVYLGDENNGLNLPIADQFSSAATRVVIPRNLFGQQALGSPSVFNFFLPDFSPAGELAQRSLVAPELQLLTEDGISKLLSAGYNLMSSGLYASTGSFDEIKFPYTKAEQTVKLNTNDLTQLWNSTEGGQTEKAAALVDYLDFYLNAGQLKAMDASTTRDIIIHEVASTTKRNQSISLAIYGVFNAPEVVVQK